MSYVLYVAAGVREGQKMSPEGEKERRRVEDGGIQERGERLCGESMREVVEALSFRRQRPWRNPLLYNVRWDSAAVRPAGTGATGAEDGQNG